MWVTLKPPFNMKCHCCCSVFKSSYVICFLLIQILQLREERGCHVDLLRAAALQVHTVQDTLFCNMTTVLGSVSPLHPLFLVVLILNVQPGEVCMITTPVWCIASFSFSLFFLHSARSQPGADPHFCSRTHSSQTDHSLRSEILQKFPWGNVRIHSFSRWGSTCRNLRDFNISS